MLERTASSIEPCSLSLQRVLPSTRACLQSRRQLHTTFWNHGAHELDVIAACQSLMRLPRTEPPKAPRLPPEPKKEVPTMIRASSFLFDFLYPNGTAALLRRLYPQLSSRIEPVSRHKRPISRHYMSSTPGQSDPQADAETIKPGEPVDSQEVDGIVFEDGLRDETGRPRFESTPEAELQALLSSRQAIPYEKIWIQYKKLDPEVMRRYRTDVLLALSTSNRTLEAWRINELFLLYNIRQWNERIVYAAVKAELLLQNVSSALQIFEMALKRRNCGNALDLLVAYGFENSAWDLVLQAWIAYEKQLKPSFTEVTWMMLQDDPDFSADHVVATTEEDIKDQTQAEEQPLEAQELEPEHEPEPKLPDGEVLRFSRLSEVHNISTRIELFLDSTPLGLEEPTKADLAQRRVAATNFLGFVAQTSLPLFKQNVAVRLLDVAENMGLYEFYIALCIEQGHKKLAANLYQEYRTLAAKDWDSAKESKKKKRTLMRDSVLRLMMDVLYPESTRALEQLQQDWYRYYNRLDRRGYLKFMNFYARRGDVGSIMRLVKEFEKYCDPNVQQDPKFVKTLMNTHAVRGDAKSARQVLEDWMDKVGEEPDIINWNILLNAYTREGSYDAAIDLFARIYEKGMANEYTYTTMMKMAAWRGDLQFNLELFEMAKRSGVEARTPMMMTILEAYCQNDRYAEAERLCVKITKDKEVDGDYVYLWNVLLRYSAKQRDLTTVNRLLETMTTFKITYNQDTYSHLLLALLYTRQSHHALHLLRLAQKEGGFEPTPGHYALLMSVFIHTGESHVVRNILKLMDGLKYSRGAICMTKAIDALGRWRELPEQRRHGRDGQSYLREALKQFYAVLEQEKKGSPDDRLAMTSLYSKMLFVLTQMRRFTTVHEIIKLYNTRYPHRSTPQTLPLKLMHNIMLADFYEKKYDEVKATWNIVLGRTTTRGQPVLGVVNADGTPAEDSKVMYSQRFRLCDPLKTMQRLYLQLEDADGLIELVATVRRKGFELDSKNWNYHIQALARLKRWRHAFLLCEEKLMPQWLGWYWYRYKHSKQEYKLPLEVRRLGSHPHYPRPISHTLLVLAKEYMELEQMSLWSREAAREFEFIKEKCPQVVRAISTMERVGSQLEYEILDGGRDKQQPTDEDGILSSPSENNGLNAGFWDQYGNLRQDPLWRRPGIGGHSLEENEIRRKTKAQVRDEKRAREEKRRARLEKAREERRIRFEQRQGNVSYDKVWSEEGYLSSDPSAPTKKGKGKKDENDNADQDIEAALKAMLDEHNNGKNE
ncbi:hypothetical protein QBC38DRAFT_61986 [Podospora fimiseda]|uniref:CoxI translation protein CYA5 n=1 Tax=Podospora fimiseda TaxID=252190 RepID=A0AAN7GZC1_9PEZI|nr:hypothetical protein QBC38DRAFT_61986 [Podospora fimiseda]